MKEEEEVNDSRLKSSSLMKSCLLKFVQYLSLTILFVLMISLLLLIVYEIRSIYSKFSKFDLIQETETSSSDEIVDYWDLTKESKLFKKENFEMDFKRCGMRRKKSSSGRIINGDDVKPHSYPWLVSLREFDKLYLYDHFCSGSLISRYHVLTAAHCLSKFQSANNILVIAGLHIRNDLSNYAKRNTYKVKRFIIHEHYKQSTSENDIALIILARPVELNENVSLVCLPFNLSVNDENVKTASSTTTTNLTFVGWGIDENHRASLELKQTSMNILEASTNTRCSNYITSQNKEKIYCAISSKNNSNVCSGDSGGSLSARVSSGIGSISSMDSDEWTVLGLASYVSAFRLLNDTTKVFCDASYPSFFTRVSAYIDWIRANYYYNTTTQTKTNK